MAPSLLNETLFLFILLTAVFRIFQKMELRAALWDTALLFLGVFATFVLLFAPQGVMLTRQETIAVGLITARDMFTFVGLLWLYVRAGAWSADRYESTPNLRRTQGDFNDDKLVFLLFALVPLVDGLYRVH